MSALEFFSNNTMSIWQITLMSLLFSTAFVIGAKAIATAKRRRLKETIDKGLSTLIKEVHKKHPHLSKRGVKRRAMRILRLNLKNY